MTTTHRANEPLGAASGYIPSALQPSQRHDRETLSGGAVAARRRGTSLSGHQSARMESDVWLTPKYILEPLGEFDLDPCSIYGHPWQPAGYWWDEGDDGLPRKWFGRVWLNPPFGNQAIHWLRKLVAHGNGIALMPARTETKMFYECVWGAAYAICFLRGRPYFYHRDGTKGPSNSGAPIVLVAYGIENAIALDQSGLGVTLVIGNTRAGRAGDFAGATSGPARSATAQGCNVLMSHREQ